MIRLASEADIPQIIALTDAVADLHDEARQILENSKH